ncbi:MAG: RagB/SusD family nutrient uptake outer membrane protein [Chitinophagales bacterium]|nr:RagB/SusD family nutrient uptake outer membrane protein [Chitinophagales bacterium]
MEKKINISCFILGLLLLNACTKKLDLQPAQNISNESALTSDASVKQVLVGAYDYFSASRLYGGQVLRNAELFAGEGEYTWTGTFEGPLEIFNRQILTVNDDVTAYWEDAYITINICNNILSALSVVTEEDRPRIEGEAKFLRAYIYFDLTRFFGQQYETGLTNDQLAVPLVLQPTVSATDNIGVSRNTVEECYAQVIADLNDAESLLPETNGIYANKYAAAAILSRVYLQKADYTNARDAADRVISSGHFALVSNYADEFATDDNTTEDIFAIQLSAQDGSNALNEFFSTNQYGGRGDIQITTAFYNLYSADDERRSLYYKLAGKYRTAKFNNQFGNISLIRLAEMYLVRSECNERLSTATGAAPVDDYNVVHTRAGLAPAISVTLDDILFERSLELAHEGFKLFEVKRLHQNVGAMPYNDPKLVFPIPEREIEVNPNLVQNPGY